jgi:energy-coupling factor transporter transmembrane protein EcfT
MQAIEGLTIFHVIAAVLGIVLFIAALVLLILSGIKTNTYPRSLLYFFAFGVALVIYPITGKIIYGEIIGDLAKYAADAKADPENTKKQELLKDSIDRANKSLYISPENTKKLIIANDVITTNELKRANEPIPVK